MSKKDDNSGAYEVGYGRPPVNRRFKKGQSGNLKGRPRTRGQVNLDLEQILNAPVEVVHNGKSVRKQPKMVALLSTLKKALKGDTQSLCYLVDQLVKYQVIDTSTPRAQNVVWLPSTMPEPMALLILELEGQPPWTKQQIAAGRAEYLKTRTPEQAEIDEAIGYEDL